VRWAATLLENRSASLTWRVAAALDDNERGSHGGRQLRRRDNNGGENAGVTNAHAKARRCANISPDVVLSSHGRAGKVFPSAIETENRIDGCSKRRNRKWQQA